VAQVVWQLNGLQTIGGHLPQIHGAPRLQAGGIWFNGSRDGLLVPVNPLAGLKQFSIEALFHPDPGGAAEQRFVHVQSGASPDRALLELRLTPDGRGWYADTFIGSAGVELPLNDPQLVHPLNAWHALALTFDGQCMRQYVNGERELEGHIAYHPHPAAGVTALGMRANGVWHFRGTIAAVRFSDFAVPAADLLRV
jgi:hypothetical protein